MLNKAEMAKESPDPFCPENTGYTAGMWQLLILGAA